MKNIKQPIKNIAFGITLFFLIFNIITAMPARAEASEFQNPTIYISANPSSISYNGSSTINWNSTNATFCVASGGSNDWAGGMNMSDTFFTGALTNTTTYYISCSNSIGSANTSVTIYVSAQIQICQDTSSINYGGTLPCRYQNYYTPNNPQVNVSISADRINIPYNESTIIRWYPTNATYCTGSGGSNGWAGIRNTFSGSFNTGPLQYTTTYTISCNNYNSNYDTRSVTVVVGNQTQNTNFITAVTTDATQISNTSAQLNSSITNTENNFTNSWFEWGKTMNLGNKTAAQSIGISTPTTHTDTLVELSPGTTYYFRAVAENSLWRNIGSILSFTTSGPNTVVIREPVIRPTPTSLVLITSSIDRNQQIIPTLDNTRPHPGDEINYTLNYQNIGTGSITGLTLRIDIPHEVNYLLSTPNNPIRSNNTLVFNLKTLKANGEGTTTIRIKIPNDISAGINLNFPATLSYIDPVGSSQSVVANVSAQIWNDPALSVNKKDDNQNNLGANVFGADFLPGNIFGWQLLIILILLLILIVKHSFSSDQSLPFNKKTTTIHE
ncbi:hypothetical protein EXS45_00605 [Candidatus Nomurabacteria bacterium]|nr:hypothetical protein [Candidatus Nomurabacteria bacterium]